VACDGDLDNNPIYAGPLSYTIDGILGVPAKPLPEGHIPAQIGRYEASEHDPISLNTPFQLIRKRRGRLYPPSGRTLLTATLPRAYFKDTQLPVHKIGLILSNFFRLHHISGGNADHRLPDDYNHTEWPWVR